MSDSLSELLARGICARWEQLQQLPVCDRMAAIAQICSGLLWGMNQRKTVASLANSRFDLDSSNV